MAGEPIITVVGNLTADPELKYVGSGTPVASFTVASTPRTYNRNTNEWEDGEALFIRCSVWREYAENVTESLSKGMRVVVQGRLQIRNYQRQDGSQGTSVEMQVDEVGPSLRYATAQVTKTNRSGGGQGGYNQGGGYQGGLGQQRGQASYNAPQGGSGQDPWSQAPSGSAFDDNPPF
ncbi:MULTISPECIES: single-stranded DNA-binding protein [Trueperella]|uniref:Single-stranded DNA-binding protein n=1 Tax=Trueperella bernardiae TaxID=59561 RepID=A0A0W1KKS1_9ACTO|nr:MULTISPECIES: single-stranded DNA-binding protein [Trueperella]KTF04546.1 Single-stranded DNA-binding protein [Trueperella bernardiae]MCM3906919.1 single-stranded DNA-binding protein [Trueperella bernardiae]MDK8601833.1 single-stranded DNA-binding protein [Trueperella bernardiae]MDV6238803.1 single-stranded DNA-binding protein [Trueperella bernardiae]OCW60298.1 single-stranded DNA-binding protein [Trueperella bernardiae]